MLVDQAAAQRNSKIPDRVSALGVVSTVGAVAAMIAGPVCGALSDRTRSRLGRRGPWILAGGAGGVVALNLLGASRTIVMIGLGWVLAQLACNATITCFSTVLPERVPVHKRGLFSAVFGVATAAANVGAAALGAVFVTKPFQGTLVLSLLAFAGAVAYLWIAPEASSAHDPRIPVARTNPLRSLVFDPRTSPDFSWAWLGRFLIVLGFALISSRLLYFAQARFYSDAVHAAGLVGKVSAVGGLAMLISLAVSGPLSDRVGRRPMAALGGMLVAVGLVALALVSGAGSLTAVYALISFGFGCFMGVDQALIADVLPGEGDIAKDLGVINIAATLPQTLAPALGSLVLAVSAGSYTILSLAGAVAAALSAVTTYQIKGVR
ncbi:MFS transporter [Streptomyces sp. NPDC002215]|uniref:MFS transporter n=1 Tax=Streptomyces sp. NPDC002215 TaxID=3154412 RepID=UPI00331E94D4